MAISLSLPAVSRSSPSSDRGAAGRHGPSGGLPLDGRPLTPHVVRMHTFDPGDDPAIFLADVMMGRIHVTGSQLSAAQTLMRHTYPIPAPDRQTGPTVEGTHESIVSLLTGDQT